MTNVVVTVSHGDVAQAIRRWKKLLGYGRVLADLNDHEYFRSPAQKRRAKHRRVLHRAKKLAAKVPRRWQ